MRGSYLGRGAAAYPYDLPPWKALEAEFQPAVDGVDPEGRKYVRAGAHRDAWVARAGDRAWRGWRGWPRLVGALRDQWENELGRPAGEWLLVVLASPAGGELQEFQAGGLVRVRTGAASSVYRILEADERPGYRVAAYFVRLVASRQV